MRLPPLEKDGRGGNFATGFARRSACRKADSTNSDMVCPRLAASRFTARIVASLIESVVFIWKNIYGVCFSVNCCSGGKIDNCTPNRGFPAKIHPMSCQKSHSGGWRGGLVLQRVSGIFDLRDPGNFVGEPSRERSSASHPSQLGNPHEPAISCSECIP
jgi:hypothetical protein